MLEKLKAQLRSINWLYKFLLFISSILSSFNTKNLTTFFLFIGNPRSGHTLVGALLDAHPNIVCSIEANVLFLLKKGYSRRLIFQYIKRNNQIFNTKLNCCWTSYSYKVEGLSQGEFSTLLAIGDKKGAGTTRQLRTDSQLISKLEEKTRLPVKILHVIRNPYDNIATKVLRDKEKGIDCNINHFHKIIDRFIENTQINARTISTHPANVLNIHHEKLIHEPEKELTRILEFLGMPIQDRYIKHCSDFIYKAPNKTRNKVVWTPELKKKVELLIAETNFLKHYSWND